MIAQVPEDRSQPACSIPTPEFMKSRSILPIIAIPIATAIHPEALPVGDSGRRHIRDLKTPNDVAVPVVFKALTPF
jgi:hypothetical protein